MPDGGEDLVMVSDLHLGPGPLECFETFYNDNAFVSFLDHVREQTGEQDRRCRLVVLGDLVDFLRTELVTNPSGEPPDEATTLMTLDRVIHGHPKVFDALGRFLAPVSRSTSSSATTTPSSCVRLCRNGCGGR